MNKKIEINIETLDEQSATIVAANLAINNDWESVDKILDKVNPFTKIDAFNQVSWHHFLLKCGSRQDMERWFGVRELTSHKHSSQWNDAASYMAINKDIESLKKLSNPTDWIGRVQSHDITANFITEYVAERKLNISYLGVPELAAIIKDDELFEMYCHNERLSNSTFSNKKVAGSSRTNFFALKIMDTSSVEDAKNTCDIVNKYGAWKIKENEYESLAKKFGPMGVAIKNWNKELLNVLCEKISSKDIEDCINVAPHEWGAMKIKLIEYGKVEEYEILKKMEFKASIDIKDKFNYSTLLSAVTNKSLSGVKFLLEENIELLEEKQWVYERRWGDKETKGSKKGTLICIACQHGDREIIDYLFGLGADLSPLKSLLSYKPFMNSQDETGGVFRASAERVLLKKTIKTDVTPLKMSL